MRIQQTVPVSTKGSYLGIPGVTNLDEGRFSGTGKKTFELSLIE